MADPRHLEILKRGVKEWNEWRRQNLAVPDLSEADLQHANLVGANLVGASLIEANLGETDLQGANLRGADLQGADIAGVDLQEANLQEANLRVADLQGANLVTANLSRANLQEANLQEAMLLGSNLRRANLRGANLIRANLLAANLGLATFESTCLAECCFGYTAFSDIDLSNAKGLEEAIHLGPSSIGIDTVYRSNGRLPDEFLRGAGVPDDMIAFIHSIAGATQFYSCFISHSSKAQEFADRLHADLQNKGIRCWFAPEDLKIGDKFRTRIDESIRIYDKLLLVLSETSVLSQWVEQEVETALRKEREQGTIVLFPIRLDDAVMKIQTGWPALIRNSRHIGDFSAWRDHHLYQVALERLVRDLKA